MTTTIADLVEVPKRGACPIATGRPSIGDYRPDELVELIRWIESDTLPRTEANLMNEAIEALGFKRQGKNIVAALTLAIDAARA